MSTTPHDALFRAIFIDPKNAASQLRHSLPAQVTERIDWDSLKALPGTFIDEGLQSRHTDLLFEAKIAGEDALVFVLFEHQSTADPWLMLRMAGYMVRIWEDFLKRTPSAERLPVIVPVVLAQVEGGWKTTRSLMDLMHLSLESAPVLSRYVPNFVVELEDLALLPEETLAQRKMVAKAKLALLLLRHARRAKDLITLLKEWSKDLPEAFGPELAFVFVWYILYVHPQVDVAALKEFARQAAPRWEEAVMTAAEKLIEQGLQKGLQKGLQQGLQQGLQEGRNEGRKEGRKEGLLEGRRRLLLRQLEIRFGLLAGPLKTRIETGGEESLDAWAERILMADSLGAVFGD